MSQPASQPTHPPETGKSPKTLWPFPNSPRPHCCSLPASPPLTTLPLHTPTHPHPPPPSQENASRASPHLASPHTPLARSLSTARNRSVPTSYIANFTPLPSTELGFSHTSHNSPNSLAGQDIHHPPSTIYLYIYTYYTTYTHTYHPSIHTYIHTHLHPPPYHTSSSSYTYTYHTTPYHPYLTILPPY